MTPEELARLRQELAGLPPEQQAARIDTLSPNDLRAYVALGQGSREDVTSKITYDQNPLTTRQPLAPGQVPFNMGPGLPPVAVTPGPRTKSAVAGAAAGLPNPVAMGVGAAAGAAFPTKAPMTEIGQGLGQSAGMAVLNRLLPGAGFLPRAATSAASVLAGGALGTQADQALGNETQSGGTQGFTALLSGLLAGRGPKAPFLTGAAGDSAFVRSAADDIDSPLARAVNSRLFRGFMRGNKQFAQDTSSVVDNYIDETFTPISQSDLIGILDKTNFALQNPDNAAFLSTIKSITKSQDPTRSSETILRTVFGKETTQANAAATFLQETLPPEEYKKVSNAWLTHVFFRDALSPMEGLGGKGSKMLLDNATEASGRGTIPYDVLESGKTVLPYEAIRGGKDFVLSGEKLKAASQRFGKKTLENIVGPGAVGVIDDVATVMDLLALDRPKDSWRNAVGETAAGTLRYQGNRFVYIASGVGSGLGAGALAGVLPMAAVGMGAYGAGVLLDTMIQKGVQNPTLMTTLRKAAEVGDGRMMSTAMRALLAAEATVPQAPPESRAGR